MIKKFIRHIFKTIGKEHYLSLPKRLIILNWMVQRLFGNSNSFPFSVHYTTLAVGFKNLVLPENSDSIKKSFAVSGGCYINIFEDTNLEIGEGTIWAFNICIQTANHDSNDRNKYIKKSVKIGKNCWIGNSVTITAGVELGDNVTIGANSVVTKSFPSNVVIAGCPAKVIKVLEN
jgi:maltose O-acetyltransferase